MEADQEKTLLRQEIQALRDAIINSGTSIGPDDDILSLLDLRDLKRIRQEFITLLRSLPR